MATDDDYLVDAIWDIFGEYVPDDQRQLAAEELLAAFDGHRMDITEGNCVFPVAAGLHK